MLNFLPPESVWQGLFFSVLLACFWAHTVQAGDSGQGWVAIIAPAKAVDISAGIDGRLQSLTVQVGDRVDEGQLLATIDAKLLKEELRIAHSAHDSARAELASAEQQARHDHARHQRLLKAGQAVSVEDLDNAAADAAMAISAQDAARARMAQKAGEIERLQQSLQRAKVTAPFGGIIGMRYLESGSLVTDHTPLLRLLTNERLVVRFAVPASQAAILQVGQPVKVTLGQTPIISTTQSRADTELTTEHNGRISWLAPAVDVASQMVFAEAMLADHGHKLRAGLDAWVRLETDALTGELAGEPL